MTTHAEMIEDTHGNLVDVWLYCSALCYRDDTGKSAHGHAYPCPDYGDSDTYCHHCGQYLGGPCPFGIDGDDRSQSDECATIRERSVAGLSDDIPSCPVHAPVVAIPNGQE